MESNSKLLMVLIGAVLITSGCMNGETTGEAGTQAISISEFSINPNPTPASQQATIQMQLENAGDAEATDVRADLFGPTISSEDRTWTDNEGTTMSFSNLQPATDTQPAIPQQDSLTFDAPNLEEGRDLPYDFTAQIFYGYETTASTNIEIMSQERYQDSGATQQSTTISNSDAPMQLEVQGSTPIVFFPEDGTRTEELCITVNNRGTGTPFNPDALPAEDSSDISESHDNTVQLEIEDVGNIVFHENQAEVDVIGNEGYHCFTMEAAGLGDVTQLEQTANIQIEAEYGYQEETSTSVTVEGRGTGTESGAADDESSDSDDDIDAPPTPSDE